MRVSIAQPFIFSPVRQRSTELTPKSGGLGYGKYRDFGLNLTAMGRCPMQKNQRPFIQAVILKQIFAIY